MAITFFRNNIVIAEDLVIGDLQIPFQNLFVWDDNTLLNYGITKVITVDVPQSISKKQFYQQLFKNGKITKQQALNAVMVGAIPPNLDSFISTLTTEEEFAARMLLSGDVVINRTDPLIVSIGDQLNLTSTQLDNFFIAANEL